MFDKFIKFRLFNFQNFGMHKAKEKGSVGQTGCGSEVSSSRVNNEEGRAVFERFEGR